MTTVYLSLGITIGIILGILIDKFIFPYFEILFEKFTYKQTVICTQYQVNAQKITREVEDVPELQPAIGFCYNEPAEEFYDDDTDGKAKVKPNLNTKNKTDSKFGFTK